MTGEPTTREPTTREPTTGKPKCRHLRLLAVLGVLLLALAACGVPLDGSPRVLNPEDQPGATSSTEAPVAAGGASSPKVFFLTGADTAGSERLQEVSRDVAALPTPLLTALLKGLTPDDRDRSLQTAIPAETQLIETNLEPDGTLVVNLNDAFFEAKGASQTKAVAQIVYTATGLAQVKRVRLLVDSQPRDWVRGDGVAVSTPLTRFDYPELNPSSQPDYPPEPAPA
jgi:spore germination protein GerM